MDPFKHDFVGKTTLHPVGLAALIVLGLAMLMVPRRYSAWPMIFMACCIAPAQRLVIAGLNFDMLRLMLIFGWVRVLIHGEYKGFVFRGPDFAMICWAVFNLVSVTYQSGGSTGFFNSLGDLYDALGMYLLFRFLIRTWEDLHRAMLGFVWISVPVVLAFVIESRTGRNVFAFLGGVPAITMVREGRMRAQGAFAHPIVAGCFWASILPLIVVGALIRGRSKVPALIGSCTTLMIVLLCNSSTPIAGMLFGAIGAGFYLIRNYMRLVRWSIVASLLTLHFFVMNAPVWHLVQRIDLSGGSTGWHRQNLIDQAINNVDEWWVFGSGLGSAHWGWGTADMTNHYIVQGLHGGVGLLALFILVIALGFRDVGRMVRYWRNDKPKAYTAWALGICLFIHVMNFIALSYFGQVNMVWYMLLAMITTMAAPVAMRAGKTAPVKAVARSSTARSMRAPRRPRPPRTVTSPAVGME